jgi:multidrug resistance efflux pump
MKSWPAPGSSAVVAEPNSRLHEPGSPYSSTMSEAPPSLQLSREVDPGSSLIRRSGRWLYMLSGLLLVAYALWMLGPYLQSIVTRDAAVTSWSHKATSPIDGELESKPLSAGQVVGPDGVLVLVRNDRLSRQVLTEREIRVDLARFTVKELQDYLADVVQLDDERAALKAQYAEFFRAQLNVEIAGLEHQIGLATDRLETMRRISSRSEELTRRGTGSEAKLDEERVRLSNLEHDVAEEQALFNYAKVRRQAAEHSIFITAAGEDPEWARGWRLELKLEKKRARLELEKAQAELKQALAAKEAASQDFLRQSEGAVVAPPGSVIWSAMLAPGTTVRAGAAVAEWLDCSILLIDVPVSDAEVSLIAPGMPADIVLEGEAAARRARVHLTRGSGSTLGREDLAALAKGRASGVAQVLLELPQDTRGFRECPVGRAAYVDFPDIGLIDVIRARLRL